MAFDFPTAPTLGQVFTSGGARYVWNGYGWVQQVPAGSASTEYVDAQDALRVRHDAVQGLTAAQQEQARVNIYAAPFDALAFGGMQINGSMEVSQEYGGTLRTAAANYALDGFLVTNNGGSVIQTQQVADAPPGFVNSLKITVTTADAVMAAGSYAFIFSNIEGYRTAGLQFGTASPQPLTIGFWVKAHRPGTYSGSARNSALTRFYAFTFVVNAADTWEFKTITIPTGDTTGAWLTTNGIGLRLSWVIASGTNLLGAPNVWAAGVAAGVTGTINGVAATTDTFQITGVIVLPGLVAPSAARSPFIMRPYANELMLAERQFRFAAPEGAGMASSATACDFGVRHPGLRAAPTPALTGPAIIIIPGSANPTQSAADVSMPLGGGVDAGCYRFGNFTGLVFAAPYVWAFSGGRLKLDARL